MLWCRWLPADRTPQEKVPQGPGVQAARLCKAADTNEQAQTGEWGAYCGKGKIKRS